VELHHQFAVPMSVDDAWTAFNDLQRIAPCFPGAAITSVDGDDFSGVAKVKLGPISLQYTGTGTFTERDAAARRAVIEASGKDKRGNGTAAAVITASLHAEGDASTRVEVDTDLKITGRPAQFGRGMIEDVGGTILGQFAECLAHTLAVPGDRASGPEPTPAAPESPGPPAPERPTPARPAPPAPPPSAGEPPALDLGSVVGPALARRLQPIAAAAVVTAVVTAGVTAIVRWWAARRRR
jgi:carbon monoxide dehydrogenase subunit G